ncbi:carbonic anhydrase domain-containing protein [Trichoderma breve]|uniref:Carbonic anhydrase n=1 Tax=Trichoderma breve TaxID=2034170 RepID=A0A9W9E6C9_9HYPO|nr:carbonic anhydrase domain-containing protein [Trichoderma breve]KAJ4860688.1 carbonic anhydrase domain-containing protein [Trichoderma breve]
MAPFTFPTEEVTFADLLLRSAEYAKSADPLPFVSEAPKNFVKPTVAIFACCDFRFSPEEYFKLRKGEAFVIRTVGGNVRPYLNDLLYLEALLNNELRDIIIIHHEDCGTTRISEEMIKNNIKAQTSNLDSEIDKIKFYMHDGQNLENSVRAELKFIRESPYIRKDLTANARGFVFYLKTNSLEEVK